MTAATLTPYAKPAHAKAARALCDALTLGDRQALEALAVIWRSTLERQERVALAWAAMMACDDEEAIDVAEAVIPPETRAGWPVVPLEDVAEEAAFWADCASPAELRAYAAVCSARLRDLNRRAA